MDVESNIATLYLAVSRYHQLTNTGLNGGVDHRGLTGGRYAFSKSVSVNAQIQSGSLELSIDVKAQRRKVAGNVVCVCRHAFCST
jgi:hypothetical protein